MINRNYTIILTRFFIIPKLNMPSLSHDLAIIYLISLRLLTERGTRFVICPYYIC
jgi:hypothetical protein